jgi:hypothetical protein
MFSPTQRAERRGLRLELEVRGKDADGRSFKDQAQSRNVSGGGICFASRRLLALGTRLELRIALPPPLRRPFGNRPIYAVRALVCRVEPVAGEGFRVGARFLAEIGV